MLRLRFGLQILLARGTFQLVVLTLLHCSCGIARLLFRRGPIPIISTQQLLLSNTDTYNAASRPHSLRLTPKLIPIPLDIIHPIQNYKRIFPKRSFRPRIRNPARHLLRPRIIVDASWVRGIVCWYDGYFVAGAGGIDGARGEELVLGFLEESG